MSLLNLSLAEQQAREEIFVFLKSTLGSAFNPARVEITYPPKIEWGNFSVAGFNLGDKPAAIAAQLAAKFKADKFKILVAVKNAGPYLNFFVKEKEFNELALKQIFREKEKYGRGKQGRGKTVMVEYFSPNTNKPLTVGHLRNICLGESLSKILKELGYQVITSCLYNDRGIALCKTLVAYQKWGQKKPPGKTKPDYFAGQFYVRFNQRVKTDPKLEEEARACLLNWEKNEKNTRALWKKIIGWSLEGFEQTLKNIQAAPFDQKYQESDFYQKGKDLIYQGLKRGVFKKDEGGVIYAPLKSFGLPDKILLRPNETSLYITQDIYLAYLKSRHHLNQAIYVVASEQDLYFQQLFKVLELLSFSGVKNYYHLSYGMVRLASGKIKSREGIAPGTGADELIAELDELAKKEVKKREPKLRTLAAQTRAHQIALAALKYYILAVNPKTTMIFDPEKSLAFTGRTGPYLQYVYARIASILKKSATPPKAAGLDFSALNQAQEKVLVAELAKFPGVVQEAAESYNPARLANYLYDLAKIFSVFYEEVPVLKAENKIRQARLALILATKIVVAKGLGLLGIRAIERM